MAIHLDQMHTKGVLQNDIKTEISLSNLSQQISKFLYPATEVWRGIMLYLSVSVRPSVLTISDRYIYSRIFFFKFCIHIVIGKRGMGLLMGKICPFLTELLPFFVLEKLFLACYSFTVHDI